MQGYMTVLYSLIGLARYHQAWLLAGGIRGEGYYLSVSEFGTSFIASVWLSLVTRSVSTSGRRLI